MWPKKNHYKIIINYYPFTENYSNEDSSEDTEEENEEDIENTDYIDDVSQMICLGQTRSCLSFLKPFQTGKSLIDTGTSKKYIKPYSFLKVVKSVKNPFF